jgi:hypothetical protein
VAVLRGYQAEIIGEVDPLVAGRSALDLNIECIREPKQLRRNNK